MKAIGYTEAGSIDRADALIDLELPIPDPGPHDLRVRVTAVSVNPVDTKIRKNRAPQAGTPGVLGWDAAGVVDAVGSEVQSFAAGDRVFYAGALNRPGTNAEFHLVDARIVGRAPATLSNAEAAALPLTAITAWELLFDRLGIAQDGGAGQTLLITGAAGGVGSMLIQLARTLTQLTVIGTASRAESAEWAKTLGAHHVIDHTRPLFPQLQALGLESVDMVASLINTTDHFDDIVTGLAPQGKLALIDDFQTLDVMKLKSKSISLHWEFMFTRSMYQTADMPEQGKLLDKVAQLVDAGRIRTTIDQHFGVINAANLMRAHALLESGRSRGKIVLEGF